jgi:hypothetical protein
MHVMGMVFRLCILQKSKEVSFVHVSASEPVCLGFKHMTAMIKQ